jgi:hypothetical protein
MKELLGKTVYLRGTGNNTRARHTPLEAKVIKVAKIYATIEHGTQSEKLRYVHRRGVWELVGNCNNGYEVYETAQHFHDRIEAAKLANVISEKVRYPVNLYEMDVNKLRQIAELLELKE